MGQSNKTDILFVIDNSGSMGPKQKNLQINTQAFIQELAKSTTSYHLGVLTTDIYAGSDGGRLRVAKATAPPYFWSSPDANDADPNAKRQAIIDGFNATVTSLGTGGSSNEAGLASALYALTSKDPSVIANNAGFLRADADLAIIVLSDEDDCSPKDQNLALAASWTTDEACYQQESGDTLYPINDLINLFAQVKGGSVNRVRAGLITGGVHDASGAFVARGCAIAADGNATDSCGCWSQSSSPFFCGYVNQPTGAACTSLVDDSNQKCPSADPNTVTYCRVNGACGPVQCPATPANRYVSFINGLSQQRAQAGFASGIRADSICQNDYHAALVALANDVVLSNCFTLPAAAVSPDDIRVTVSHQQADGTQGPTLTLPRYDPQGSGASGICNACGGNCAQGAWQYQGARSICLACGAEQQLGDHYDFTVLSGVTGNASQP